MCLRLRTWEANVLRSSVNDCWSPITANTRVNTAHSICFAGTGMPLSAMRASNPAVLSAAVLPPVFGPEMMRHDSAGVSARLMGTTARPCGTRLSSSSG